MRRSDREIKDFDDLISVMKKCDVCRLALFDKEYPYILPLNFGMHVNNKEITLYFHGATEGKKYELIRECDKVSFEMDCSHRLVTDVSKGNCTMEFESIIGNGEIEFINDEDEKIEALNILMGHYPVEKDFKFNKSIVPVTVVLKLSVLHITGKRRMIAHN